MRPEPAAELENEVYERESFRGLDLSGLRTTHCTFHECDFTLARLNGSEHAGSDFANSLFESANLFGVHFADCRLVGATFVAATLTGLTVEAGDWSYVLLRGQDLSRFDLRRVRLREADLAEADLTEADLRGADLTRARVHNAILAGADLREAVVDGVDLSTARISDARLDLAGAVQLARSLGAVVE
jgi:fluoroquinolone resistance protein